MNLQLNADVIRTLYESLLCSAYFIASQYVIHGCLYNRALADIRPTGAGIK